MSAGDSKPNPVPNSIPSRWKPGQSGNPTGGSKSRRQAKRLRRAVDAVLEQQIPDEWLETIDARVLAVLPPDTTFAEVIAVRLALAATHGRDISDILGSVRTILMATEKPDQAEPSTVLGNPVMPGTEERRAAIAKQLGLDDQGEE